MDVVDVQTFGPYVLHSCQLPERSSLGVGDAVECMVDYSRRHSIAANHTMTHALNFALRTVIGPNVDQKGSLVDEEKLRFDFNHNLALEVEQIQRIENIVRCVRKKLF
jgi:alanyl-tRNA synthetase